MVSRKRRPYASDIETSTDSEDAFDDQEYTSGGKWNSFNKTCDSLKPEFDLKGPKHNFTPGKRAKCSTKNALMARENRLKKKIYIQGLEGEVTKLKRNNKTLQSILDNQSLVVADLRKEIKYLKSVVANSSDLMNLLRTINCNTGMSVTTSLDKSLTLKNNYVPKNKGTHPWAEKEENFDLNLSDVELGIDIFDDSIVCSNLEQQYDDNFCPSGFEQFQDEQKKHDTTCDSTLKEHNYTINSQYSEDNDVGVCLHVSKHKVSLEFCASCSENATKTWSEVE